MVQSAPDFRIQALPSAALHMLGATWPFALLFVAGNTVLGALGATDLFNAFVGFLVTLVGPLALYCLWLRAMYQSIGLGGDDVGLGISLLRLIWAHILVAFVLAVAASILMLGIVLALQVMLIAAGMNTENFPETTEALMAILVETGVIWPSGALLAFMYVGFFYLCVRLWLVSAATVDHGVVRVFQTWPWTKGHALPLFFAVGLFVVLPLILGEVVYWSLFGWPDFSVRGDGTVLLSVGIGEVLVSSAFRSLWAALIIVFTAAIAATAYRAWGQPRPA